MSLDTCYLVIGVDRSLRVGRKPRVARDEVAIRINLHFPDSWGRTIATIDVQVPDYTPEVTYDGSEPCEAET